MRKKKFVLVETERAHDGFWRVVRVEVIEARTRPPSAERRVEFGERYLSYFENEAEAEYYCTLIREMGARVLEAQDKHRWGY